MGIKHWFVERWPAIRDNAVYDIIKWLFLGTLGTAVFYFVKHILPIWTSVTADEAKAVAIVMALIVTIAILATYSFSMSRRLRSVESLSHTPVRLSPPPIADFGGKPSASKSSDIGLRIEILEVAFRAIVHSLVDPVTQVFVSIRVTNREVGDTAATEWNLTVTAGDRYRHGNYQPFPAGLCVERPPRSAFLQPTFQPMVPFEHGDNVLRRGVPKSGWLLFELFRGLHESLPFNAQLTITVTDSMGGKHEATWGPTWYVSPGDIKGCPPAPPSGAS